MSVGGFYKPTRNLAPATIDKIFLDGFRVAMLQVTLPQTRDIGLVQTQLADALIRCRQLDIQAIVRAAYSWTSTPADPDMEIVLDHLDQLSRVIGGYGHNILTVQAGMLGSWGEQNNGPHCPAADLAAARKNRTVIINSWAKRLVNTPLSVRTPMYLDDAFPSVSPHRLGFLAGVHNDAFLASETNLGTYARDRGGIDYWKDYVAGLYIVGGETCQVSAYSGPDNALAEIKKLKVSYLNADYHQDVLKSWTNKDAIKLALQANAPKTKTERNLDSLRYTATQAAAATNELADAMSETLRGL